MNLYHDRQLYNTLIPLSHESPAIGLRISRSSGSVEFRGVNTVIPRQASVVDIGGMSATVEYNVFMTCQSCRHRFRSGPYH